jgi:signal transduction histidine kinase
VAFPDDTGPGGGFATLLHDQTSALQVEADRARRRTTLHQVQQRLQEIHGTLEERVQHRTQQLEALAVDFLLTEQRERHRIAQILHNHLQQLLYGLHLHLQLAQAPGLAELEGVITQALQTTRTLAVDLSPPILPGEGLPQALRWLAQQMATLHGLQVEVQTSLVRLGLAPEMRVLLYQMVRELLVNVVQHAETQHATVTLHHPPGELQITVADRGRGFAPAPRPRRAAVPMGWGLPGIQARLALLHGALEVESHPGQGTRITLRVPLAVRAAPQDMTGTSP